MAAKKSPLMICTVHIYGDMWDLTADMRRSDRTKRLFSRTKEWKGKMINPHANRSGDLFALWHFGLSADLQIPV